MLGGLYGVTSAGLYIRELRVLPALWAQEELTALALMRLLLVLMVLMVLMRLLLALRRLLLVLMVLMVLMTAPLALAPLQTYLSRSQRKQWVHLIHLMVGETRPCLHLGE